MRNREAIDTIQQGLERRSVRSLTDGGCNATELRRLPGAFRTVNPSNQESPCAQP
jgi:hypothetical protein